MPITILAPRGTASQHKPPAHHAADSDSDSDGGADIEGDISMRPAKRARGDNYEIVTPGEIITDDPQWMRFVCLSQPPPTPHLPPSSRGVFHMRNAE